MQRDLTNLARVAAGVLHGDDTVFGTVVTDSRALEQGALFVALRASMKSLPA